MITPEELVTPLTFEEAKKTIYDAMALTGVATTGWKPGFVVRTMIASLAVIVVVFSELATLIAKSAFLDFASGDWLTFLARYVYGTERVLATFATGVCTLDNSAGGGLFDWGPDELVVYNPDTGKLYRNASTIHLDPGQVLSDVPFYALEAGSASTSLANTIVAFETPYEGLTVTNPALFLGTDDEEDPSLRVRCREVLGARSAMGPEDAYAAAARRATLSDGTPIGVNRIRIRRDGRGVVYVYVATATGAVAGTVSDAESPLGRVNLEIQKTAAPLCVTAIVQSGVARVIDMAGTLYVTDRQGFSDLQLNQKIAIAAGNYFASTPIGGYTIDGGPGYVYADDLKSIARVLPTAFKVEMPDNVDVPLLANQFPVLGFLLFTAAVQKQAVL